MSLRQLEGPSTLSNTIPLRGCSLKMPVFGLGTWLSQEKECKAACLHALRRGYRHIDTADMYQNEDQVGDALLEWAKTDGGDISSIFITTKLKPADHSRVKEALKESLTKLKIKCVDLFLMHTPKGGNVVSTWKEMNHCKNLGLCKNVVRFHFNFELIFFCTKSCT
eukprot:GSMAST32.ASY1.ANO1.2340.1 assembled CDS